MLTGLKITRDESSNPREDYCNLFTFAFQHRRMQLGDACAQHKLIDAITASPQYRNRNLSYETLSDLVEIADRLKLFAVLKPIYAYEHSGIMISSSPFSCRFDSGQLGVAFVLKSKVKNIYNCKRVSKKRIGEMEKELESEIKQYNHYLSGDVFEVEFTDSDGDHEHEWYYGTDFDTNGMKDDIPTELQEKAKQLLKAA